MLKFFRRIRQKLVGEANLRRYLIYAIGEILLVVIGILIALQINNQNEYRKEKREEISVLRGILGDLKEDAEKLNIINSIYQKRLTYYNKVDPTFIIDEVDQVTLGDTTNLLNIKWLMQRVTSFRTNSGNYKAMIGDGRSGLIGNKSLLNDIQNVYDVGYPGTISIYETIKTREESLVWKRNYEYKYNPYKYVDDIGDKEFLAELNYFFRSVRLYLKMLKEHNTSVKETISKIENELERLDK